MYSHYNQRDQVLYTSTDLAYTGPNLVFTHVITKGFKYIRAVLVDHTLGPLAEGLDCPVVPPLSQVPIFVILSTYKKSSLIRGDINILWLTPAKIYKFCVKQKSLSENDSENEIKLDDWFTWGLPSCAYYPACTLCPNQLVVPVWMYVIFNSSCVIFGILPRHAS